MRKAGIDSRTQEKRITATTRQLESMIRLSEAHARMRWSEEVELEDVEEANRLIKSALRESAVSLSSLFHSPSLPALFPSLHVFGHLKAMYKGLQS
jgi:DNA replicative helicase MCM subunit Mcm2 (Cdc46/Mcm family)